MCTGRSDPSSTHSNASLRHPSHPHVLVVDLPSSPCKRCFTCLNCTRRILVSGKASRTRLAGDPIVVTITVRRLRRTPYAQERPPLLDGSQRATSTTVGLRDSEMKPRYNTQTKNKKIRKHLHKYHTSPISPRGSLISRHIIAMADCCVSSIRISAAVLIS